MGRWIATTMVLIVLSGCARTIFVSSQKDLDYQVSRDVPLFLLLGNDVSVGEKNAYSYLRRTLEYSGFRIIEGLESASIVMTFSISKEQYLYESYGTIPDSRMTIGYLGNRPFSATTFGYQTYPMIYVSDQKMIKLRLFDAQTFREGKRLPLWEGSVVADPDAFDERLQEYLSILVEKIGIDFQGRVRLKASN